MSSAASVGGDERPSPDAGEERLRLFLALQLPETTLDVLEAWRDAKLARGRVLEREQLHVTLAFLGHRPAVELPAIVRALRDAVGAAGPLAFEPAGWRETRSVGMIVLRDLTGEADALARRLHGRLSELGIYRPEARPWLPHVTMLRFRTRPRLAPPLPETGTFVPSGAAAYLSRLHPSGARYEVLEGVSLNAGG
ncbi:2'-5' RNA ligase family protein [Gaiella sp.]|uniref:2'-5' RNA ligase family protein n=1 Tax=Gaiella sp. TaxID=2663207 RepID=UPI002E3385BF|nr:2'-5' RNA ligase family protein [Gaiella sp.]HEX5583020.1 2'-5' RNA ligase family protein [Gaiella sp.]